MKRYTEEFAIELPRFDEAKLQRVRESLAHEGSTPGLEVTFAAIHEGLTRNKTFYTKEGLTHTTKNEEGQPGGLKSWTTPYQAPILQNHDPSTEPLGRVTKAEWIDKQGSEPGYVELTALITRPEAIEKFLRGEYATGSIGMDVDKAECSICGIDKTQEWCYHERGQYYKKGEKGSENEGQWIRVAAKEKGSKLAQVNIGNVWAREYSVVSIPSDMRSTVRSMKVRECLLTEGEQSFSMMEGAQFVEHEQTATTEGNKPAETTTTETVVTEEQVRTLFAGAMESDPVTAMVRLADAKVFGLSIEGKAVSTEMIDKLVSELEENHPELDSEFNAIREAVLSTSNTESLSDSSFAVVKTTEAGKLRLFAYKNSDGSINQEGLLTGLSRVYQLSSLSAAEQQKGLRKLLAIARKAKVGAEAAPAAPEVTVDAAKEILAKAGLFVSESDPTELAEQLEEARQTISERETENTALTEKVAELTSAAEATAKNAVIEKILLLQETTDDEREQKVTELTEQTIEHLSGVLETLEKAAPEGQFVVQRVPKAGLALEQTEEELNASTPKVSTETVLAAYLGSPRARAQWESATKQVRK